MPAITPSETQCVIPCVQRTSPGHTSANMVLVSVKTARSYTVSTRMVIVPDMHT